MRASDGLETGLAQSNITLAVDFSDVPKRRDPGLLCVLVAQDALRASFQRQAGAAAFLLRWHSAAQGKACVMAATKRGNARALSIDMSELRDLRVVVVVDQSKNNRPVTVAAPVARDEAGKFIRAFSDNGDFFSPRMAFTIPAKAKIVGGRLVIRSGKLPRIKRRKDGGK